MSKSIKTNVLKQNCYLSESIPLEYVKPVTPKTYISCDESVTSSGIGIVHHEEVYPITPEYVKSFAPSTDYRSDPLSAIANAPSRTNLGDVSFVNDLSSMSSSELAALSSALLSRIQKASEPSAGAVSSSDGNDNNNDNVDNKEIK